MKKVLAIVLTAIMVVSMFAVCASAAPEGTAIKSAADFAAMTAEGKYYLANDITLDATYTTPFKGTLDGNGKTVTISGAMFSWLAGATIKNLTIAGTCGTDDAKATDNAAPLASRVGGKGNVIENITNKATVVSGSNTSGLIGKILPYDNSADETGDTNRIETTVTIKNCVNEGNVTSSAHAAGIVGTYDDDMNKVPSELIVDGCSNKGNITTTGNKKACAGLLGNTSPAFKDEADENKVKTYITVTNCTNSGAINSEKQTDAAGYGGCGGIASNLGGNIVVKNCQNTGSVTGGKAYTGGVVACVRAGTGSAVIEQVDNTGAVTCTAEGKFGEILGAIENASGKAEVKNYYFTAGEGKTAVGFVKAATRSDSLTGDETPAAAPVYKAPAITTEASGETTKTPSGETTTDKKETDSTGDTSMIIALTVVGIVAFIGTTAVVMRKKEN